jgi:hypothetical protein
MRPAYTKAPPAAKAITRTSPSRYRIRR